MKAISKEKYLLHTKLETARMILAFMCREKLNEVAELFIKTCPYLEFERNAIEEGYAPFNFAYQPISEILHDYSQMGRKMSQLVERHGCNLSFPRSMTELEKIEYLLELPTTDTTFAQNESRSGVEPSGMQNATMVHTLQAGQEMYSKLGEDESYKENENASFVIIPNSNGTGTGDNAYTQGATVSNVDNYNMSAASNATAYIETSAAIVNDIGNEPTQYVLFDDTGNEQQVMIEILPQHMNGMSLPDAVAPTNQPTHIVHSTNAQSVQFPSLCYSAPPAQISEEVHPEHHDISVGLALTVNSEPHATHENQYHVTPAENNQLMLVSAHEMQHAQETTQTTLTETQVTATDTSEDVPHICNVVASSEAVRIDEDHSTMKKPNVLRVSPPSTVTVTTVVNEKKVVTPLNDLRRSLDLQKQLTSLTDIVSSTTSKKDSQTTPVSKCKPRVTSRQPSAATLRNSELNSSMKSASKKKGDMAANQAPLDAAISKKSPEVGSSIDPTISALEEWRRIRSVNRSNFENFTRQEICKDMDQQEQQKSVEKRERKKASTRLARLRKKIASQTLSESPLESNGRTDLPGPAEQTSTKPVTRKRRQRIRCVTELAAKRTKRFSGEVTINANDSLERHGALLEAALYTPMKSDQESPMELSRKELNVSTSGFSLQPVALSLTAAKQMPTETIASGMGEGSPIMDACQTGREADAQPVVEQIVSHTIPTVQGTPSVPVPERQENINADSANIKYLQDSASSGSTAIASEKRDLNGPSCVHVSQSPLQPSPLTSVSEAKVSRTASNVTQDELLLAVSNIIPRTSNTPTKLKTNVVAKTRLSDRKKSFRSNASSSSSSSDSECNSSCSSASSTTMEEDEDIRQMYANAKRYRTEQRARAATSAEHTLPTPSKAPQRQNVMRISAGKCTLLSKSQMVHSSTPNDDLGNTRGFPMPTTKTTISRTTVISNRKKVIPKLVEPQQQPKKAVKISPSSMAPQRSVMSKIAKKEQPAPVGSLSVATPNRTKTPRKQQLIPTKLDLDDTFIPSTSPHVRQRPTLKSPKPTVRKRFAAGRLRSPVKQKTVALKSANTQPVQAISVATVKAKGKDQTIDVHQQENAPLIGSPNATTSDVTKKMNSEAGDAQDAIYAVLAQIHGK